MLQQRILILSIILSFIFAFSGCTSPQKLDIIEFCKEFNQMEEDEIFSALDFFETSETSGQYLHCSIPCRDAFSLLCTAKQSKDNVLMSWQVTLLADSSKTIAEDLQAQCFSYFINGVAILTRTSEKEAEQMLLDFDCSKKNIRFENQTIQKEKGKWRLTFLSRKEGLSLIFEEIEL